MTGVANLSGRLPSGDANGLAGIVRQLVDDPGQVHVLVVLADALKTSRITDTGDTVPTVRIRRVEAITDPADRESLRRLMMREFERRTGQPVLPLELENDVRAAFDEDPPDDDPPPPPRKGKRA